MVYSPISQAALADWLRLARESHEFYKGSADAKKLAACPVIATSPRVKRPARQLRQLGDFREYCGFNRALPNKQDKT